MELIDWITIAFIFVVGFVLGHRTSTAIHVRMFKMILQDLGVTNADLIKVARNQAAEFLTPDIEAKLKAAEESDLDQIEIKVEKHNDTLYAFRKDNDAFLGQGSTREELIDAMAQRLKNVRLTVVEGNEYMKSEA